MEWRRTLARRVRRRCNLMLVSVDISQPEAVVEVDVVTSAGIPGALASPGRKKTQPADVLCERLHQGDLRAIVKQDLMVKRSIVCGVWRGVGEEEPSVTTPTVGGTKGTGVSVAVCRACWCGRWWRLA